MDGFLFPQRNRIQEVSVRPDEKFIVYTKVTDYAGNYSVTLRSSTV